MSQPALPGMGVHVSTCLLYIASLHQPKLQTLSYIVATPLLCSHTCAWPITLIVYMRCTCLQAPVPAASLTEHSRWGRHSTVPHADAVDHRLMQTLGQCLSCTCAVGLYCSDQPAGAGPWLPWLKRDHDRSSIALLYMYSSATWICLPVACLLVADIVTAASSCQRACIKQPCYR